MYLQCAYESSNKLLAIFHNTQWTGENAKARWHTEKSKNGMKFCECSRSSVVEALAPHLNQQTKQWKEKKSPRKKTGDTNSTRVKRVLPALTEPVAAAHSIFRFSSFCVRTVSGNGGGWVKQIQRKMTNIIQITFEQFVQLYAKEWTQMGKAATATTAKEEEMEFMSRWWFEIYMSILLLVPLLTSVHPFFCCFYCCCCCCYCGWMCVCVRFLLAPIMWRFAWNLPINRVYCTRHGAARHANGIHVT